MTRWSAITRTRRGCSALAYGSRSTAAAEKNGSYTTSGDATQDEMADRGVKPVAAYGDAPFVNALEHGLSSAAAAASRDGNGYWLKLEFADGRWTVKHLALQTLPQLGDLIEIEPDSRWRVKRVQTVTPARGRAPERDYLVCTPA
ncbi:MAG: hypothetical protein ACRDLR_02170 [Gaiellaceae bacterium]